MLAWIATRTGVQLPSPPLSLSERKCPPQSLCTRVQPFGPKPGSAIRISASVIVKCADKCGPVCRVRRLPVSGFIRLKHVVIVTQNLLTADNVFQRHSIRVSQDVIKHHERGRASKTRFAMKMRPGILRQRAGSKNKAVHLVIERPRMVGNSDVHVISASAFDDVALCTRAPYRHTLRGCRISAAFFHWFARPNIDFAPRLERLHSGSFVRLNF